eukprot:366490-Chlamydomonas_euryale.AAC.12
MPQFCKGCCKVPCKEALSAGQCLPQGDKAYTSQGRDKVLHASMHTPHFVLCVAGRLLFLQHRLRCFFLAFAKLAQGQFFKERYLEPYATKTNVRIPRA